MVFLLLCILDDLRVITFSAHFYFGLTIAFMCISMKNLKYAESHICKNVIFIFTYHNSDKIVWRA